jgi:hypothetical protein
METFKSSDDIPFVDANRVLLEQQVRSCQDLIVSYKLQGPLSIGVTSNTVFFLISSYCFRLLTAAYVAEVRPFISFSFDVLGCKLRSPMYKKALVVCKIVFGLGKIGPLLERTRLA